jgi:nitroreductase / dihydropteridine reductase
MNFIDQLNWRYAAKRMIADKAVPTEKLDNILEAIRLSATSYGLQPYNVIVVKDKEMLQQIQTLAYNQPQVGEASALIVFAVWDKITQERIDNFFNLISSERGVPAEALAGYKAMVEGSMLPMDDATANAWMARQAYIGLGTGLAAAAIEEVDTCPMEGFASVALDEYLQLPSKGLKSVAVLAVGYRDVVNDPTANMKKVRIPMEEFVVA